MHKYKLLTDIYYTYSHVLENGSKAHHQDTPTTDILDETFAHENDSNLNSDVDIFTKLLQINNESNSMAEKAKISDNTDAKYVCEECQKGWESKNDLENHLKENHPGTQKGELIKEVFDGKNLSASIDFLERDSNLEIDTGAVQGILNRWTL